MERLTQIVRIQLKGIFRKKSWVILIMSSELITLSLFWFCFFHHADPIFLMPQTVFGQAFMTLVFLMIGIECRRELRRANLEDVLSAYLKHPVFLPFAHIITIILLAAIMTLALLAGMLIPFALDKAPFQWLLKSGLLIILLYFLPSVVMGIWGLFISQINSRKDVYLPAVLFWLLTSSLVIHFTEAIPPFNRIARVLSQFINMGFNNFMMYQNVVTGAKIEMPRWMVRFGFAISFALLYIAHYNFKVASNKSKKRNALIQSWTSFFCVILLMLSLSFCYSEFFFRFADDYYTQLFTSEKSFEKLSVQAGAIEEFSPNKFITLEQTDIELDCSSAGMKAEVKIKAVVDTTTTAQSFTLFSELVIDEILVDGEMAEYTRNNDYIMVYFPVTKTAGDNVTFAFQYHGYSLPSYPVNETTVQLNRAFPWIPWPGIKAVTQTELTYYTMSEAFFVADWQHGDKVMYTLHYIGPGDVYTNLQQISPHYYSGYSYNGVSLYSGMIYTQYRGIDTYVPASLYRQRTVCADTVLDTYDLILDYCEKYDTPVKPQVPENVIVIQMEYPIWSKIHAQANELFSWDAEWEIRLNNEFSLAMACRENADSLEDYHNSTDTVICTVIPYLVNPAVGYPTDADRLCTSLFVDILAGVVLSETWDADHAQQYAEKICRVYYSKDDMAQQMLNEVFSLMLYGEKYDETLKKVYHQLLTSDPISPDDILLELYNHKEA